MAIAIAGRIRTFLGSFARYRQPHRVADLRLKRKHLGMVKAVTAPLVVSVGSFAIMWSVGVSYETNFAISGSVFAVASFVAAQLQVISPVAGRDVRVILGSRGPYSRGRAQALYDALADKKGWSCSIKLPPDGLSDLARWQGDELRNAVRAGADAIVLENRSTFLSLQSLIREAKDLGIYIVVMGDSPGDPRPTGIASTFISSDPSLGGWLAGNLVIKFLSSHENSAALIVARSEPVAVRPRGAYCSLAIALSEERRVTKFITVDDSEEIGQVITEALDILLHIDGPICIACLTDRQLMKVARGLRAKAPISLCDRIYLIGYDGAIDANGDLLIANSPIQVFGTVDTQGREQGRLIGEEILSIAAGLEPREFLRSTPREVLFDSDPRLSPLG
jgi:hypothetical protein